MNLASDVWLSLRALRRNPVFTATAVAILAIAIGANAAIFTLINTIFLRGFPSVDPDNRLVYIVAKNQRNARSRASYPDFEDWRAQAKSFDGLAFVQRGGVRVLIHDRTNSAETCDLTHVSANAFQVLRQRPILGRDFEAADEKPGAAPVAILNYSYWDRHFGKDPAVVGQTISVDRVPTTVIGIMLPGFEFPVRTDLWMPTEQVPNLHQRDSGVLYFTFGRLRDGVTIPVAQAEMDTIGHRLANAWPQTNQDYLPAVMDFPQFFLGAKAGMVYRSLFGAVGFVLLIACANLTNLMLVRAMGRSREISVRLALGAGRWRIIRQVLVESSILSGLGGLLAWWIAKAGIRVYEVTSAPPEFYNHWHYTFDYRVLAYCVAISLVTGIVFGLAPAIRLSKLDLNSALKDGGRGTAGERHTNFLSSLLISGQIALALMLLSGAGALIHSFLKLYNTALGVETAQVLALDMSIPSDRYASPEAQISFYDRLKKTVEAIPGVESAAIADAMPANNNGSRTTSYEPAGDTSGGDRPSALQVAIGPGYFRTLRGTLLAGREFNDSDGASGLPVAIVNQKFTGDAWPRGEAVGKRLRSFDRNTAGPWLTVVGVAGNIIQDAARQKTDPVVYLPSRQLPRASHNVFARTRMPPEALAATLVREIQAMDPDVKIWHGPFVLSKRLEHNIWDSRVNGTLFLIFASIALLLAALGLYAVIAYWVSRRTQEFGVRIAVGAGARDILSLVFRQGAAPLSAGLALGLVGSVSLNRVLQSQLFNVPAADPIALSTALFTLILAAILGCWLPARRAARVDPVLALRHE